MGTGKTTLGKMLAKRFSVSFYDSDTLIQDRYSASISALMTRHGEAFFRKLETQVLRSFFQDSRNKSPFILATGGGIVLTPLNKGFLKSFGTVYWLKASSNVVWRNVKHRLYKRPLLKQSSNPRELVSSLMIKRAHFYQDFADVVIDIDNKHFADLLGYFP